MIKDALHLRMAISEKKPSRLSATLRRGAPVAGSIARPVEGVTRFPGKA